MRERTAWETKMESWYERTEQLLGSEGVERLAGARVAVFGVGGVGGYVVEALARCGVGALDLIDADTVTPSNINRQIIAAVSTLGKAKVEAARDRVLDINPACLVNIHRIFYLPETADRFDFRDYDHVVDAIDTVTGKLMLAEQAKAAGTPIISSMGAGNKLDPTAFRVADIYETRVCPLAKVMRRELKKRGIASLKVVYSEEEPLRRGNTPGSVSFVPSVAGLIIAGEVVRDLLRADNMRKEQGGRGMYQMIDGKKIAQEIKDELKERMAQLKREGENRCLAVIQVGDDPASGVYVNNKKRACEYVGVESLSYALPEETTEEELLGLIEELGGNGKVNGILVQLPLPAHIDEEKILLAIPPDKDVDGFHPVNVGNLSIGRPGFLSCTPAGVIQLLKRSGIEIAGKECVVLGRSNIVGKPMAMLLLRENGTVTVCHSKTKNLREITRRADILVAAIGKPKFIDESYVKEGAVVIDVGIHRDANNKLCGDVDFERVAPHCSAITPVPGGVGPMTIAMLMSNCVEQQK